MGLAPGRFCNQVTTLGGNWRSQDDSGIPSFQKYPFYPQLCLIIYLKVISWLKNPKFCTARDSPAWKG